MSSLPSVVGNLAVCYFFIQRNAIFEFGHAEGLIQEFKALYDDDDVCITASYIAEHW